MIALNAMLRGPVRRAEKIHPDTLMAATNETWAVFLECGYTQVRFGTGEWVSVEELSRTWEMDWIANCDSCAIGLGIERRAHNTVRLPCEKHAERLCDECAKNAHLLFCDECEVMS